MTISAPRGNRPRQLDLAAACLLIGVLTLSPQPGPRPDVAVTCLRCGDLGGPDLVLNILLFLPFGFALARRGARPGRALILGLAFSLGIELLQLIIPGRATTLRDVLCNGGGAFLGAIVGWRLERWIAPSRATVARLVACTGLAVGAIALTGWMMDFAPSAPPYFGHWSPRQEHLEHWNGRLSRAELDGIPVPDWRIADDAALREAMRDGFTLDIAGIGGAPTYELGGILTVSDGAKREVLLVGPESKDLIVRLPRRAALFRFGAPEARFRDLLRDAAEGAPLAIRIVATRTRVCARVNDREECRGRPAAASLWILLFTDRAASATARILLNAVTLAALVLPVGLLLRSVTAGQAWTATVVLVAGTAVAARGSGLALPTLPEWLGLAAGLVAGLALNRLVTRTGTQRSADPTPVSFPH